WRNINRERAGAMIQAIDQQLKNKRIMRSLEKFITPPNRVAAEYSDETLNDVRSALDDILKRIRMEYLPQTVWRNINRERAGAMIQAIDQQLKNKRIMRSLEKFITPPNRVAAEYRQDEEDKEKECSDMRVHKPFYFESTDDEVYDEKIVKEQGKVQVKEKVSKILPRIEKSVNEQLEAEVLIRSFNEAKTSYAVAANLSELKLKKILRDKMENNKSTDRSILSLLKDVKMMRMEMVNPPLDQTEGQKEGKLEKNLTFVLKRLKVDTLIPELLAGPTFELMKGSCKSLVTLEYFLEELYKATTDQLDGNNPEGNQYPHDLRKPLPLIPNLRGRRVITFDHFINNDLGYLSGGVSSRTYATLATKTKAADYGRIKWIKDLVPKTIWSQVPIVYDKHTLWGISHWGQKRQHFYEFAVNRESARDVYSRHRIIAITKLTIVEWHNYKHLDCITVRRDDEKLYTFKEGDYRDFAFKTLKACCFF
nr:hypothetical protein [Tanacetum cinerariifolium]